jgi:hypothetical protein
MFSTKDSSYQGNVGVEHDGSYMFFDDTKFTPRAMRNFVRSMCTATDQLVSAAIMSASIVSPAYGTHIYSMATGYSLLSQQLPYPSEGMILTLNFLGLVGDANISVFASTGGGVTGVSLVMPNGSALSSFECSAAGFMKLLCVTDGTWSIVEQNASITVRKAS